MSEKFRALMIEKEEDTQTVKMVDIEDNDLMEGNVLVNVTHSTLNYKDGLVHPQRGGLFEMRYTARDIIIAAN